MSLFVAIHRLVAALTRRRDAICEVPAGAAVRTAYWSPPGGPRNFGDMLSPALVAAAAARADMPSKAGSGSNRRLLAIGSILHFARPGDVVWGAGMRGEQGWPRRGTPLDIRAVRGPLTARALRECGHAVPSVYGDPALLIPRLFPELAGRRSAGGDYVVIPHFSDLQRLPADRHRVSPLEAWERCVERIAAAGFVISSSLHGIIVADALGVPARYLRLSDFEPQFKYDDHAQATGRASLVPARSVADALSKGPDRPPQFDADALEAAFPADLWACPERH